VTALLLISLLVLADRSAGAIDDIVGESGAIEDDTEPSQAQSETVTHPERDVPPVGPEPDTVIDRPTEYDTSAVDPSQGTGHETGDDRFDDPPGVSQSQQVPLSSWLLMANVAVTQGLAIVVLLGAAWYFQIPADAFGVPGESVTGLPAVGIGLGFGVVLWAANDLSTTIADAVGAAYDERVRELLAPDSPQGWVALFGVALPLIALGEELLFRGAVIGVTHSGYGISEWALAVLASLAFALGHGAQGRVGVVVTGTLGFVLAAGYIVTGSLLVVVVAHYVINALEFLVHEYLGVAGLSTSRQ
jgi:membrane protease YdiL (CAAX protease family)